jgi:hypothetical protein
MKYHIIAHELALIHNLTNHSQTLNNRDISAANIHLTLAINLLNGPKIHISEIADFQQCL